MELLKAVSDLGERAYPVVRQEFLLVQHVFQDTQQPVLTGDGQQVAELAISQCLQVRDLCAVETRQLQIAGWQHVV